MCLGPRQRRRAAEEAAGLDIVAQVLAQKKKGASALAKAAADMKELLLEPRSTAPKRFKKDMFSNTGA